MITRCSLCPGSNACIPPDGPKERGGIIFIGEAPGVQENKNGRPFIGRTGEEVNKHYLPLAGLRRETVIFTNAISCLPISAGGKLDPKRRKDISLLESCAVERLHPLLESLEPRLIVPLGAFACKALGLDLTLDHDHGIPVDTHWGPAFPMYHPALGLYEPKKMLHIRTDYQRLRSYMKGKLIQPVDEWVGREDYREVTDESEIEQLDTYAPLGCDTESKRGGEPYCFTYSQEPGSGRLIRSGRRDLLAALQRRLEVWQGPILFHNWFYDWPVTESMALQFPYRCIVDTMAEVARLGNLPQGLKTLAWRELGMVMQDFEDLVIPYSREHVLNYYRMAQTCTWPKPDEELEIDSKTGLWKVKKPQGMNTKLKRFFTDYGKDPDKDVFNMWEMNWAPQQAMIEAEIGQWPGMCISHVPFAETLFYACRDADSLIRFYPKLKKMQARVRKFPQDQWRVA